MTRKGTKGLTAVFVRSVTEPGKYYDGRGDGLVLRVAPGGSKQWIWRGTVRGRRRDYGLGSVRYTTLAEARRVAFEYKRIAAQGGDPRQRDRRHVPTFAEAAEIVIDLHAARWKPNSRSPDQWRQSLADYAHPALGDKAVDTITTGDVMAVLTPIWTSKPTTAKRVRQRISSVMAWAIAEGHRDDDPAGPTLVKALPKPNGGPKKHLASIPHSRMADAMATISGTGGHPPVRLAVMFTVLTAARSGEVRGATWSEIDVDANVWMIPGERMKSGRPHRVPLSEQALEVLAEARNYSDCGDDTPLFPSVKGGELGPWQLSKLVTGQNLGGTLHGFRSSFRTWCADQSVPREIAELCLAHRIGSAAEQAYNRGDVVARRREVMEAWGRYITR